MSSSSISLQQVPLDRASILSLYLTRLWEVHTAFTFEQLWTQARRLTEYYIDEKLHGSFLSEDALGKIIRVAYRFYHRCGLCLRVPVSDVERRRQLLAEFDAQYHQCLGLAVPHALQGNSETPTGDDPYWQKTRVLRYTPPPPSLWSSSAAALHQATLDEDPISNPPNPLDELYAARWHSQLQIKPAGVIYAEHDQRMLAPAWLQKTIRAPTAPCTIDLHIRIVEARGHEVAHDPLAVRIVSLPGVECPCSIREILDRPEFREQIAALVPEDQIAEVIANRISICMPLQDGERGALLAHGCHVQLLSTAAARTEWADIGTSFLRGLSLELQDQIVSAHRILKRRPTSSTRLGWEVSWPDSDSDPKPELRDLSIIGRVFEDGQLPLEVVDLVLSFLSPDELEELHRQSFTICKLLFQQGYQSFQRFEGELYCLLHAVEDRPISDSSSKSVAELNAATSSSSPPATLTSTVDSKSPPFLGSYFVSGRFSHATGRKEFVVLQRLRNSQPQSASWMICGRCRHNVPASDMHANEHSLLAAERRCRECRHEQNLL